MWHKQSFTQFWSQSDAYSRRSSLKLTYIHHPLVVCTHQICCAVAVPIALSQDRLLHGHNRLVNWTPCSRMRESKLKNKPRIHPCNYCLWILCHFVPGIPAVYWWQQSGIDRIITKPGVLWNLYIVTLIRDRDLWGKSQRWSQLQGDLESND